MSPWLPVASAGFFAILAIAERFYARFVPDVSDQKRHIRRAAWVAFHVLSLSSAGLGFWTAAHERGPVTSGFVLFVSMLFFILTLVIINWLANLAQRTSQDFSRFLVIYEQHLKIYDQSLNLTREEAEILDVLASKVKVPDEVKKKLQGIFEQLDGKGRVPELGIFGPGKR
jgi:hypothetical protein